MELPEQKIIEFLYTLFILTHVWLIIKTTYVFPVLSTHGQSQQNPHWPQIQTFAWSKCTSAVNGNSNIAWRSIIVVVLPVSLIFFLNPKFDIKYIHIRNYAMKKLTPQLYSCSKSITDERNTTLHLYEPLVFSVWKDFHWTPNYNMTCS